MSKEISGESIACQKKGFSVAASPLNAVKLELIISFVIAGLFWLLLEGFDISGLVQVLLLSIYGIISMLWIIIRTQRIVNETQAGKED